MSEAQMHHERTGSGRPSVVLVHGLCCAGEDWAAQVAALSPEYETLTVDLRGHGRSTGFDGDFDIITAAADVAGLARDLDLAPAVIVGHSMGCRVAVEAACTSPETFAGVVLVDGSALAPGSQHPGDPLPAVDFAAVREGLFDAMFVESSDPAVRRAIVERALDVPVAVGQAFHDAMVAYDAGQMAMALGDLAVPVHVVQSTYMNPERRRVPVEPGMPVPWLELIERKVTDHDIEIVRGVGHFTMIEAPGAVTAAIASLAKRIGA